MYVPAFRLQLRISQFRFMAAGRISAGHRREGAAFISLDEIEGESRESELAIAVEEQSYHPDKS